MNYPPAPMAPMSAPPPPPAPPKSNAVKWILVGCGITMGLAILACGGIFTVGYFMVKKVMHQTLARVKPTIAAHPVIQKEIGNLQNLEARWSDWHVEKGPTGDRIQCVLDARGDKGSGSIHVLLTAASEKKEMVATLTFISSDGSRRVPMGSYLLRDDGKGGMVSTPIEHEPPGERRDY